MKTVGELKIKFFYKVSAFLVAIILSCSLAITLVYYYRLNTVMSKQNMDFIHSTSQQTKSNILNLMKSYELIAGNIYSDNTVQTYLKYDYDGGIDYSVYSKMNVINHTFDGIRNNNNQISKLCLYKLNPGLIVDGRNILDSKDFIRQELLEAAIAAKGRSLWTAFGDSGKNFNISLLKYINVMNPGGVLQIQVKEQSFYDLYKSQAASQNLLFITDGNFKVISSNQRNDVGKEVPDAIKKYLMDDVSTGKIIFNKNPYYVYAEKITGDWSLVLLYNSFEVEKEKKFMVYYIVTFTGILILSAIIFSLFFARRYATQVDKLLLKIREIETGNLDIRPTVKKVNEFYLLDNTLCVMAHSIKNLKTEIYQAVKQKEESDIKFLQMQMNPHFLYNLLSAIRWISLKNKQPEIIYIIDHLSNFYRIALSKGNEIVNIEAEINLINSYVALQNLCYKDQIKMEVNLSDELAGFMICKMTLQPFVENSIVHGRIQDRILNISIDISKQDEAVKIRIEDDGAGVSEDYLNYIRTLDSKNIFTESASYGITNTLARLSLFYGSRIKISAARKNPGTLFVLVIDTKKL